MDGQHAPLPLASTGPRTGSDPENSPQEIAVLRAEVRALEHRMDYFEHAHRREHELIQTAVNKAEMSVDKRLEAMNELRAQINTERSVYLSRSVYETNHEDLRRQTTNNSDALIKLTAELSALREDLGALKSGQQWLVRVVVAAVVTGVVGTVFALLRP